MKQLWTQGRWYREWAPPFVPLGAEAPTIRAALSRIVDQAILPAHEAPPGRDHARVAALEPRRHLVERLGGRSDIGP